MDAQQQKLLEVVFECLENAGVSTEDMSGSNTAVYVGNFTIDYQAMQSRDLDYLHRYAAAGGGTAIMPNHNVECHGTGTAGARPLPFAFVFNGQGAQYAGVAKEPLEQNTRFLASIRELDQILQSLPSHNAANWTLEQTILDPPDVSKVNDVTRSQLLCTAVQISLVELLRSWWVSPSAMIGHSSGGIAASYRAGLLTAPQAIQAAYFRGFAVGQVPARGAMTAACTSVEGCQRFDLGQGLEEVRVACVNAPENVTLRRSERDVETVQAAS
ncbi:hypothetical protein DL764_001846 [Monosporascus ibericus]|uniref:Malonyl-CoA:ACP transacylase (MAT) domain-containing protein n=1 Tax=Monosporascus ibericus TaxID=155417 RepID=A0A4Q4TMV6_9PEZI|nr:hypothetical protein DL764_001846 [Monosporascus ibericus]